MVGNARDIFGQSYKAFHNEIEHRRRNENEHDQGTDSDQSKREISQLEVGIAVFYQGRGSAHQHNDRGLDENTERVGNAKGGQIKLRHGPLL